jgi:uncharacterized protein YbjT (DUF2867 family)
MKIAIIGATRGIGLAMVQTALADGYEVTALARRPDRLPRVAPGPGAAISGMLLKGPSSTGIQRCQSCVVIRLVFRGSSHAQRNYC